MSETETEQQERPKEIHLFAIDVECTGYDHAFSLGCAHFKVTKEGGIKLHALSRFTNATPGGKTILHFPTNSPTENMSWENFKKTPASETYESYGSFEPRCWKEFWSKNLDVLGVIVENKFDDGESSVEDEFRSAGRKTCAHGSYENEHLVAFRNDLDVWCITILKEAEKNGTDVEFLLVSGNPGFDFGLVNAALARAQRKSDDPTEMWEFGTSVMLNYLVTSLPSPGGSYVRSYNGLESDDNLGSLRRAKKLKIEIEERDPPYQHNHLPECDAAHIGWKYADTMLQLGMWFQ